MAKQRNPKPTEKPTVTLEELPRGAEELTNEEAEAAKGASSILKKEDSVEGTVIRNFAG